MVDKSGARPALVNGLLQAVQGKAGLRGGAGASPHDVSGTGVNDESDGGSLPPRRDKVTSKTQSLFGAGPWNGRLTKSSGHGSALLETAVPIGFPRITP